MKPSHIGMIAAVVVLAVCAGVGLWWTTLRNPVATPKQALERYADGRANMDSGLLADCMWVDPALYPDEGQRAAQRESRARQEIGVQERVAGASVDRQTTVLRADILSQAGERAQGEIEFKFTETTGVARSIIRVELELQDGGWRVYSVQAR